MQLIYSRMGPASPRFYLRSLHLTRPDRLCSIFKALRRNRGLSKSAFAARIGFSVSYVNGVESGGRFPSLQYCFLCAEMFGANPSWVKAKYAKEAVERYSDRVRRRLGLDRLGGGI